MRLAWAMFWIASAIVVTALICISWADRIRVFLKSRALPFFGSVWGAVAGAVPKRAAPAAPAPSSIEDNQPAPAQSVPDAGQFLAFLWKAKWPILFLAAWLLIVGSIEGWFGKSRGHLRLEAEIAEANARVAQHEARLGELSRDLAVNTERDRARRSRVLAQAEQELNHAADKIDPDALYDAYASGYRCLLTDDCGDDGANPPPPRAAPVRGAFGSAV